MASMWWIYALLSALTAAVTAILVKYGVTGMPPLQATAIRTLFVLPVVLAAVWFERGALLSSNPDKKMWIILAASGLTTALSWIFYSLAMQAGRVAPVSAVDKTSLVFAALLALLFFREIPSSRELLGLGLVVAGTFVLISGN
jgi:transporter family protein